MEEKGTPDPTGRPSGAQDACAAPLAPSSRRSLTRCSGVHETPKRLKTTFLPERILLTFKH